MNPTGRAMRRRSSTSGSGPARRLRYFAIGSVALLMGSFATCLLVGSSALQRQERELRDKGEATTFAELHERQPAVPEEANSVRIIIALADELKNLDPDSPWRKTLPLIGKGRYPEWGVPWPAETVEAISTYIVENESVLARLDAIHDLPQGRFEISLETGQSWSDVLSDTKSRPFSNLRLAAKMEALAALHAAFDQRPDAVVRRIETIVNMSAPAANDITIVGSMVAIAIDALAIETVERALAVDTLNATQLQALAAALDPTEQRKALQLGLRGDCLRGVGMLQQAAAGKVPTWIAKGWLRHQQAKLLENYGRLIDATTTVEDAMDAAKAFDARTSAGSRYFFLANMFCPSLSRAVELWGCQVATSRCAIAALAVERYRLDHGDWPEALADLVPDYLPAVPLDPFDGEALRYRHSDTGLTIYSVAEDRFDNEGYLEVEGKKRKRGPDRGFRLLNPELRGLHLIAQDNDATDEDGNNAD